MKFEEYYLTEDTNPLIVYHGTNNIFTRFNFKNALQKVIWFTSDIDSIKRGESGAQGIKYILKLSVDLKNPAGWEEYDKHSLDELQQMGYDGAILKNKNGEFDGFVFKPSQVKILERIET